MLLHNGSNVSLEKGSPSLENTTANSYFEDSEIEHIYASSLFGIDEIPCKYHIILKLLRILVTRIPNITKCVVHQTIHNYSTTLH